ncbi:MAG: hypothetical protein CYG61_09205 [Actinobacteria bacterium]|nr:MAG: hypothetical protein CYG61_09205 [Actinomycetota bacterium]
MTGNGWRRGGTKPRAAIAPRAALPAERPSAEEGDVLGLRALCHDLRHPAAVIDALVAAVQVECELPPQAVARLGQIASEARRISELCRHVMTGDGGRSPLLRLDRVATEVVRSAQVTHAGIHILAERTVVEIDDADARRILWNLLDNACRASGPKGDVLVSISGTEKEVRLEVADSGPGFGQGEPGAAALGLSIVRATAKRHGGVVEVGEGALGGALVAVVLPPPRIDLVKRTGLDEWFGPQMSGEGEGRAS